MYLLRSFHSNLSRVSACLFAVGAITKSLVRFILININASCRLPVEHEFDWDIRRNRTKMNELFTGAHNWELMEILCDWRSTKQMEEKTQEIECWRHRWVWASNKSFKWIQSNKLPSRASDRHCEYQNSNNKYEVHRMVAAIIPNKTYETITHTRDTTKTNKKWFEENKHNEQWNTIESSRDVVHIHKSFTATRTHTRRAYAIRD